MTLDKGEEFFAVMNEFSEVRNSSFTFSAIGGCNLVELAYYDLDLKEYITKEFVERNIEIITMTGNVAWYEGKPLIHTHGIFGRRNYECFGGHITKLNISATAEIVIDWLDEKIKKEYDPESGLKFFCK